MGQKGEHHCPRDLLSRWLTGQIPFFTNGRRCVSHSSLSQVAPILAMALASTDPGGGWPRCRAQGTRLRRGLQVRERKAGLWERQWRVPFLYFWLPPIHTWLHIPQCAKGEHCLSIQILDCCSSYLVFITVYLIFISLPPGLINCFSLDPETIGLFMPKCWLPQHWGLVNE